MLRTSFLYSCLFLLLGTQNSCIKELDDESTYINKIGADAEILDDGSVKLIGKIIRPGATDLSDYGFDICYNGIVWTRMNLIGSREGDQFFGMIDGFNLDNIDSLRFKAWGVDAYGIVYSDVFRLDSIKPKPIVAPCTYNLNYLDIGNGLGPVEFRYDLHNKGIDDSFFRFEGGRNFLSIYFKRHPRTKVYYTGVDVSVGVYIDGFYMGAMLDSLPIYVNKLGKDQYQFESCQAKWKYENGTAEYPLQFNVRYPLN